MKQDADSRRTRSGFTLIETLITVAILALIVVMATPSFVAWHVRDQVDARARALFSTLSYARSEAVNRGARVTVCRIDAARHCLPAGQACRSGVADWSCGWAVVADHAGSSTVLRAQAELAAISIAGTQTNLTFTPPAGQLIGSFRSFDLAPQYASRATQGQAWRRCIRIAAGGRPRISDGACAATS
ncbi:GspH/FimT family pseudopilin [Paraburkholderia sp. DHOC27]|uniref:GspH/FimT family pseudopilin n=1 Tax=Paraburkholderia sp. DHOC27 TaxID=2303330 RepID=UPI00216B59B9|nr:GspH/FimT family pseudopilin [Paraburkholderia sp. DHOC27]